MDVFIVLNQFPKDQIKKICADPPFYQYLLHIRILMPFLSSVPDKFYLYVICYCLNIFKLRVIYNVSCNDEFGFRK